MSDFDSTREISYPNTVRPMSVGEIFGGAFRLTAKTFSTVGALSLVLMMVIYMLYGFALGGYFESLSELDRSDSSGVVKAMVGNMLTMFVAGILLFFGSLLVQTLTARFGWETLTESDVTFGEALRDVFRRPLWYVVAQTIMMAMIFMVAYFAFVFLAVILGLGGSTMGRDGSAGVGIVMIVLGLGFFAAVVYFLVSTSLRVHFCAIDERGPWRGLIQSMELVRTKWGKTFGVLLLAFLMIMVVSIPFSLASFSWMFDMMRDWRTMSDGDPTFGMERDMARMGELFTWHTMLLQGLLSGAIWLFLSNVLTMIYTDLRARRGDFDEAADWSTWENPSGSSAR